MQAKKVIVCLKGGQGNQLFCYAAARRLALANDAELVIDDVSGFIRDTKYRRKYALEKFNIKTRKATPAERMEPFERWRRIVAKFSARRQPFHKREYIEQEGADFDPRLLDLNVRGTIYLDGYWQSEKYFKDVEETIRKDFQIILPQDLHNQDMAERIQRCEAVAIHVRLVAPPWGATRSHEGIRSYYRCAVEEIERKVHDPYYFLFSDDPSSAKSLLKIPDERLTCVSCNHGESNSYADFWLMSLCKHFIIADSTFSWWGAWLGRHKNKIITVPITRFIGKDDLIPNNWLMV
ncbi:MAG: alpha-1,2-fucosyltransferase [Candidatus Omnitrophica bacterium]|nr:alpha-1,2-fucosyltransferase [Candidatus Omnitrophota bacterium]MBU1127552.1 alpha-1,2-fucosyltransferase [Candidatus Omnitrophota bacterium]MBU1785277.1 alpha-1,2-fucosyltransferase [Candidatus Omnitrophota bacterium]MBU1852388.1 alpha-1,2-fucosyltransferase [Candidatus Omnitrophota bacterium]